MFGDGFSVDLVLELEILVVFGGYSYPDVNLILGTDSNTVHMLNTESNIWIQPNVEGKPPGERRHHHTYVQDDVCYVYGARGRK